jgi:large subunit ribosomal protein L23
MNVNDVIIRAIISEKSMQHANSGKFTFHVAKGAHKGIIKKTIEDKFKVNVVGISTNIVKGKKTRSGTRRIEILKSAWKKAVVKLKTGQKIALFDVGGKS